MFFNVLFMNEEEINGKYFVNNKLYFQQVYVECLKQF